MKTKPMLAKASVVRNILAGLQTQDRRPVSDKVVDAYYEYEEFCSNVGAGAGVPMGTTSEKNFYLERAPIQPGDTIWVRETLINEPETESYETPDTGCINCGVAYGRDSYTEDHWKYSADKEYLEDIYDSEWKPSRLTVPSIHMPKWACRLFLKVTAVRVERVGDISEEDAIAEGMKSDAVINEAGDDYTGLYAYDRFGELWRDLYPGHWQANGWVWVYEFERTDKPAGWPGN